MEGEVILKGSGLIAAGLLFICFGILGWKHRREDRINIIEAAILKSADAEPMPRNKWDRVMAYLQPVLMLIFGPFMVVAGIGILTLMGE